MGKRHILPIQASRVGLRLLEERDLPLTLAWRNQDHIRRWFFFSDQLTPQQHAGWFSRYQQRDDDFVFIVEEQCSRHTPSAVPAAQCSRHSPSAVSAASAANSLSPPGSTITYQPEPTVNLVRPIGQVSLYNVNWSRGTAEFGRLMIGEADAAGRGLAREATAAVVDLAFHRLGLQEVYLEVIPNNVRAIKVYEACGFEITASTDQAVRMSKTA